MHYKEMRKIKINKEKVVNIEEEEEAKKNI